MESVDRLLEHFSFGCGKLVGTRSIYDSDNVGTKPVRFKLSLLDSLLLILGVLSQDEITQLEVTWPDFMIVAYFHSLLIGS